MTLLYFEDAWTLAEGWFGAVPGVSSLCCCWIYVIFGIGWGRCLFVLLVGILWVPSATLLPGSSVLKPSSYLHLTRRDETAVVLRTKLYRPAIDGICVPSVPAP